MNLSATPAPIPRTRPRLPAAVRAAHTLAPAGESTAVAPTPAFVPPVSTMNVPTQCGALRQTTRDTHGNKVTGEWNESSDSGYLL